MIPAIITNDDELRMKDLTTNHGLLVRSTCIRQKNDHLATYIFSVEVPITQIDHDIVDASDVNVRTGCIM